MSLPPIGRWPEVAVTLGRTYGFRGARLRAIHELRRMAGGYRAAPRYAVASLPAGGEGPWQGDRARLRAAIDVAQAVTRADRVVAGEYEAFSAEWRPFPADPTGWRRHPGTGAEFPEVPWWRVPHFSPILGDIKQVWEPARFGWVYDLLRAWHCTGDGRYPEAFHRRFTDWLAAAPPFAGPHWACGQETAIRAIALLHAEAGFPASSEQAGRLATTLGWSGERIADAIGYAISQRNNHALSEAAGLIALGTRLGTVHPEADRWVALGRQVLEREIREQFAPDGWYIQHSFNYLRVALDQCVAAESALRVRGAGVSDGARVLLRAAIRLVAAVIGPDGSLPNHGPNDGAMVLPRSLAGFGDHRPTLTQAAALFGEPLPDDVTLDAEALAWLGGLAPARTPTRPDGAERGTGWAVVRRAGVIAFLRAGRYRSRPGHLDVLHLDVRTAGGPLVVDPGTYLYNAPPPWGNGLATARVHNGPLLDDQEPGLRGPRFLWYLWPAGEIEGVSWDGGTGVIRARSATGVTRQVRVGRRGVEIRDRIAAGRAESLQVRWTLHPEASAAAVQVEGGGEERPGMEGAVAGWYAPRYGERLSTRYIDARRPAVAGAEIVTRIRTDQ